LPQARSAYRSREGDTDGQALLNLTLAWAPSPRDTRSTSPFFPKFGPTCVGKHTRAAGPRKGWRVRNLVGPSADTARLIPTTGWVLFRGRSQINGQRESAPSSALPRRSASMICRKVFPRIPSRRSGEGKQSVGRDGTRRCEAGALRQLSVEKRARRFAA